MQIQSIRTLILGTLLSAGALFMSGCKSDFDTPNARGLCEYMDERGDTKADIDNILKTTVRRSITREDAARQSALDSMAYRDLFNETHLANDSAAVADFNKIASKFKLENNLTYYGRAELKSREAFADALTEDKTRKNIIDSLLRNFPSRRDLLAYSFFDIQKYQLYGDKYFYNKFFRNHGLNTDEFNAKFEALTEKITPKK